jgi:hypothetical protein
VTHVAMLAPQRPCADATLLMPRAGDTLSQCVAIAWAPTGSSITCVHHQETASSAAGLVLHSTMIATIALPPRTVVGGAETKDTEVVINQQALLQMLQDAGMHQVADQDATLQSAAQGVLLLPGPCHCVNACVVYELCSEVVSMDLVCMQTGLHAGVVLASRALWALLRASSLCDIEQQLAWHSMQRGNSIVLRCMLVTLADAFRCVGSSEACRQTAAGLQARLLAFKLAVAPLALAGGPCHLS